MTDNLLERLRSRKLDIDPVGNEGTLPVNPDGEEAANYIEELGAILADAYGAFLDWDELLKSRADQEAVARIEALEAEVARLREALKEVATMLGAVEEEAFDRVWAVVKHWDISTMLGPDHVYEGINGEHVRTILAAAFAIPVEDVMKKMENEQ